jgi:ATP-dependent DNA helicase RecG
MRKLGLVRDIDLALHLPLRHEDETEVLPIGRVRDGQTAQVEGVVRDCQVELRSRRQLIVRMADDSGVLTLRFLNFYPAHQKTMARGQRLRVRGEVRHGFFGPEMLHPSFKAVQPGDPLPSALTPVYPASAQLPQAYLRKAVAAGLARAALQEILPQGTVPAGLPSLKEALRTLHHPPPGVDAAALADRSHPAWERLKFEELLAQQLAQAQSMAARAQLRAPVLQGVATWQEPADPGVGADSPSTPERRLAPATDTTAAGRRTREAIAPSLHARLLATLPFQLTAAQARVCAEIDADLARPVPMHRLLQGDVGSGKTVVAALAAARAIDAGWQCALMAPTEILAEQHFRKLVQWLTPLGVTIAWLTGSRKGKARRLMVEQVASGQAALVVGTHAVIQDDVVFARLGLAIVDEQHRFGVAQRLALRRKLGGSEAAAPGGADTLLAETTQASAQSHTGPPASADQPGPCPDLEPHLLTMSATPIPRTLAMTYFADLDVSTIDELPPGRTPIVTKVFADSRRLEVIARIRDEVERGKQVYWVCPLIEESEHLDLQHATAVHAELCAALGEPLTDDAAASEDPRGGQGLPAEGATPQPGTPRPPRVALLHGRIPSAEKAAVMAAFSAGHTAVLVATTVIEVGVDVPNASLMVIEHAERFGLAQLHQLRGRVGRGDVASVCVLIYTPPLSDTGKARLRAMAETTDGFEIARRDLQIRGPGEFMGARQSGEDLLRFADLDADAPLLAHARRIAPQLLARHPEAAEAHVARWLSSKAEYLKA